MESFKVMFGWLDKIGYVYPKVVFAVKYVMLYLYFVWKMKKNNEMEYILFFNVWYLFKIKIIFHSNIFY